MKKKHKTNPVSEAVQDSFVDSGLSREQKKISEWLEKLRFRKQLFGGVSEEDVWKKIEELNSMYQVALNAERIRYDTMIEHYRQRNEIAAAKDISYIEQREGR